MYSFSLKAPSKADAKAAVAGKFDGALGHKDWHTSERDRVVQIAHTFIDLLADDDSRDVVVNVVGNLAGHWRGAEVVRVTGANFSIGVGLVPRGADA